MDAISIVSFLGAAVLLTLMPGPDNLFVLAQSISKGKSAGIATASGLCTGLIVHITAAAGGISARDLSISCRLLDCKICRCSLSAVFSLPVFSAKKRRFQR